MKKCIAILLCVCSFCVLATTAFASDSEPDYRAEYEAQYGKMPVSADYSSDVEYQAAYDIWLAGFAPYVNMRYAEWSRQKAEAEEAARLAAEEQTVSGEAPLTTPIESAGSKDDVSSNSADASVDPGPAAQYPDRVRTDLAGNIYSLDGELLSPGITPAVAPDNALASGQGENDALLSGELADPDNASPVSDTDTLAVIAGLVSDIATDPPVSTVEDLRPADAPVEVLTGLKALVTSIFGEYTPVTTTSVVSQTVGNDTQQYLIETVAPGAAGVDYEWVAGVALFAIMLFCLMKLLGGVLK